MEGTEKINKIGFLVFQNIPFLWELRIIIDWTFTKTAIDLFQWFKFEQLYANFFLAKCLNKVYLAHPRGEKQSFIMKIIFGATFMIGIIVIIAGPLLLFSTVNPIASPNPVLGGSYRFAIKVTPKDN